MSASVVFASPPPVLASVDAAGTVVCVTGADGTCAGCGGVGAGGAVGSVPGRGGMDGMRPEAGGIGVTGLVELGLFVGLRPSIVIEARCGSRV
jgi:hypothetical protein